MEVELAELGKKKPTKFKWRNGSDEIRERKVTNDIKLFLSY